MRDNAYAYAKACGIIGRSFLGKRLSMLGNLHSLGELDRLLFPDSHGEFAGMELLRNFEHRITSRSVKQIYTVINSYSNPPEILVRMLRAYELSDLKACIHQIVSGRDYAPVTCNLGRFAAVDFNAFPDMKVMLKNSEYNFLLSDDSCGLKNLNHETDITPIEIKLDNCYYTGLINSLSKLSYEDKQIMQKIIADEINLRNCSLVLRMRSYFHKSPSEAEKYLLDIKLIDKHKSKHGETFSLSKDASDSLNLPLDTRSAWHGWKWEKFLNAEESAIHWTVDPKHFQNAASKYLYRLVLKSFHISPLTTSAIFCFVKLKQFEEDILTSMAEGLAIGMDGEGVFSLLEAA